METEQKVRQPEVEAELETMNNTLDSLQAISQRLGERLESVLRGKDETPVSDEKQTKLVSLAERLRNFRERVSGVILDLESILERTEL